LTNINGKSLKDIAKKTRNRKFNFESEDLRIEKKYIIDAERCDTSKIATGPVKTEEILNFIRYDRSTRQYFSEYLTFYCEISRSSVIRIMKANNFYKIKITKKPGLTPFIKKVRLQFYLRYKNWTLKNWKTII
jgi:hypothetical protein